MVEVTSPSPQKVEVNHNQTNGNNPEPTIELVDLVEQCEKNEDIVARLVAELPLTDETKVALLGDHEKIKSVYGYDRTFPIRIGNADCKLRVSVSPSAEMRNKYLKTDTNLGKATRKIYTSLHRFFPNIQRVIEIEIADGEGNIIGMNELHTVKEENKIIAVPS